MISIDTEMHAYPQSRRKVGDTFNDAVRALLGLPPAQPGAVAGSAGALLDLVTDGTLTVGETVTWTRPRSGEVHTATIDAADHLVAADGPSYLTPDMCASAIAGHPCKGWPA
ncbi:hypothetical protein ACFPIJ_56545 [Dactylosporangium cerinum]|uniref:Uncharacterized protein n=1 Tax=Dactylosporangium cerinum TaxID=1434730 RepID=A0ABV9WHL9_9ACTN